jgi:hypothetical protein
VEVHRVLSLDVPVLQAVPLFFTGNVIPEGSKSLDIDGSDLQGTC